MNDAQKNSYVKTQLTNTMFALLKKKKMNDISIRELCNEAGVGRASFYRNFDSKEDVIVHHLKSLLEEWALQYDEVTDYYLVQAIFEHYYANKDIYILLYKQGLSHLSLQSVKEACGPRSEQPNMVAYTSAFIAYGLYGWIEEWFKRGMIETPKEMGEFWLVAQEKMK